MNHRFDLVRTGDFCLPHRVLTFCFRVLFLNERTVALYLGFTIFQITQAAQRGNDDKHRARRRGKCSHESPPPARHFAPAAQNQIGKGGIQAHPAFIRHNIRKRRRI